MTGRRLLLAVLVAAAAVAAAAAPARADGDPASDYLVAQQVFLPFEAKIPQADQQRLLAVVGDANRKGYAIRVALIGSAYDLGSVTALWRRPQDYARFLGVELSYYYKQRLLIAMPNGLGFNWPGHDAAAGRKLVAGIDVPAGPAGLAQAAIAAVQRLAAASGVKAVAPARVTTPSQQNAHDRVVILVAAFAGLFVLIALLEIRLRRRRRRAAPS